MVTHSLRKRRKRSPARLRALGQRSLPPGVFSLLGGAWRRGGLPLCNLCSDDVIGGPAEKVSLPDGGVSCGVERKAVLFFGSGKGGPPPYLAHRRAGLRCGPPRKGTLANVPLECLWCRDTGIAQ